MYVALWNIIILPGTLKTSMEFALLTAVIAIARNYTLSRGMSFIDVESSDRSFLNQNGTKLTAAPAQL